MFLFYTIEGGHEQEQIELTQEAWEVAERFKIELKARLDEEDYNTTSEDIETLIKLHLSAQSLGPKDEGTGKWTPIRTFSFTHEYLSTIGFGQVVPKTVAGMLCTNIAQ